MKAKPILFNGPMVRAILDGEKTQTRRLLKPQPPANATDVTHCNDKSEWWGWDLGLILPGFRCPYGVPGDSLYVRETWRTNGYHQYRSLDEVPSGYADLQDWFYVHYRADNKGLPISMTVREAIERSRYETDGKWRASIHMPRWASRLPLEITDVRAERVQDITPEDCEAEGISGATKASPVRGQPYDEYQNGDGLIYATPRDAFCALWDSVYAKPRAVRVGGTIHHYESYPWEAGFETREHKGLPWLVYGNPWVWPITFKVVT